MTTLGPWHLALVVVLTGGLSYACGDDGGEGEEMEELPDVDCPDSPPDYADVEAFETACVTCHSSELNGAARNEAPEDIDFDSESAANTHAEKAAHEVFEGEMPPEDSGIELTDRQKQQLYEWALCM